MANKTSNRYQSVNSGLQKTGTPGRSFKKYMVNTKLRIVGVSSLVYQDCRSEER